MRKAPRLVYSSRKEAATPRPSGCLDIPQQLSQRREPETGTPLPDVCRPAMILNPAVVPYPVTFDSATGKFSARERYSAVGPNARRKRLA